MKAKKVLALAALAALPARRLANIYVVLEEGTVELELRVAATHEKGQLFLGREQCTQHRLVLPLDVIRHSFGETEHEPLSLPHLCHQKHDVISDLHACILACIHAYIHP